MRAGKFTTAATCRPTSDSGSYLQTAEVRSNRAAFKKGNISEEQYKQFNFDRIAECVKQQEEIGLDVLVHGEFERNDMVEYFGESLVGFLFTQNGWVQSYGTRCVKPPVVWGDISRAKTSASRTARCRSPSDCGLKTRGETETWASLQHMVQATVEVRKTL